MYSLLFLRTLVYCIISFGSPFTFISVVSSLERHHHRLFSSVILVLPEFSLPESSTQIERRRVHFVCDSRLHHQDNGHSF